MTIFDWLTITNTLLDVVAVGVVFVVGFIALRKVGLLRKRKVLPPPTASNLEEMIKNALRK